jgi:Domain of unknown function (DUF202)
MAHDPERKGERLDPRVYFAAERTLLAWVRTGLAMMGSEAGRRPARAELGPGSRRAPRTPSPGAGRQGGDAWAPSRPLALSPQARFIGRANGRYWRNHLLGRRPRAVN